MQRRSFLLVVFLIIGMLFLNQPTILAQQDGDMYEDDDWGFEDIQITSSNSISINSNNTSSNPPKALSPAAVAIDTVNGRVLYDKNAFSKRQMASTTKMMTAILAVEKGNLDDMVNVSKRAASVGGSQANLKVGEKIKLGDLLYALMLPSGNDAAIAIAEHIGGSVENFITMMDQKALEIGAKNTKYGSPHGLDRENYSTAYDLAMIARYGLKNPVFAKVVSTRQKSIPREGYPNGAQYYNTNEMLDNYKGADGVKTGYTGPAGRCLVTSATRDGWQVVTVVLGANSRYSRSQDSQHILDYVFANYPLVKVLTDGQKITSVPVIRGQKSEVGLVNKGEISIHIKDAELERIEREFSVPDQLIAPVKQGQAIGKVILHLGDMTVGSCVLYADDHVKFWTVTMNLKKMFDSWLHMKDICKDQLTIRL